MTDTILRLPEVKVITGLSDTTIWRLECDGKFPSRKRVGARAVGWLKSDLDEWIGNLKEPHQED